MRWPRLWVRCSFIGLTSLLPATPAAAQVVTVLHSFGGNQVADGGYPSSSLILSGSTLYGVTGQGGILNQGTVFQIKTDGTGYAVMHLFTGGPSDGAYPRPLLQSG